LRIKGVPSLTKGGGQAKAGGKTRIGFYRAGTGLSLGKVPNRKGSVHGDKEERESPGLPGEKGVRGRGGWGLWFWVDGFLAIPFPQ